MFDMVSGTVHKMLISQVLAGPLEPKPIQSTMRLQRAHQKRKIVFHNNVLYHDLSTFPNLEASAVEQMYRGWTLAEMAQR